jgi:hypothetical protein
MARLDPPPPSRAIDPAFVVLEPDTALLRIYNPNRAWKPGPVSFNHYGPFNRFDHHQSGPPDPDRGVLYAARTLSCCLVEVFGDAGVVDEPACCLVRMILTRQVRILDLCGSGAMQAGTLTAIGAVPDRALTQAWARYFYETPDYKRCDGLRFHGAHNNEECFVFFERAEDAMAYDPLDIVSLDAPSLYPLVLQYAVQHNLLVTF